MKMSNALRPAAMRALLGVLLLGAAIAAAEHYSAPGNQAQAEAAALRFGARMYPSRTIAVSCQGIDTDRNQYVSCTMTVDSVHMVPLECADRFAIGLNGCRMVRMVIPVGPSE